MNSWPSPLNLSPHHIPSLHHLHESPVNTTDISDDKWQPTIHVGKTIEIKRNLGKLGCLCPRLKERRGSYTSSRGLLPNRNVSSVMRDIDMRCSVMPDSFGPHGPQSTRLLCPRKPVMRDRLFLKGSRTSDFKATDASFHVIPPDSDLSDLWLSYQDFF